MTDPKQVAIARAYLERDWEPASSAWQPIGWVKTLCELHAREGGIYVSEAAVIQALTELGWTIRDGRARIRRRKGITTARCAWIGCNGTSCKHAKTTKKRTIR